MTLLKQGPMPERAHTLNHADLRARRQAIKQRLNASQPLQPEVRPKLAEARKPTERYDQAGCAAVPERHQALVGQEFNRHWSYCVFLGMGDGAFTYWLQKADDLPARSVRIFAGVPGENCHGEGNNIQPANIYLRTGGVKATWSPNGAHLLYTVDGGPGTMGVYPKPPDTMYVVGLDGTEPRAITQGWGATWQP